MKRGMSELLATVLLILVTISAAGLIYSFVKPIITDTMAESEKCGSAQLLIAEDTCYNAETNEINIEISTGLKTDISGISILVSGDNSQGFKIINGSVVPGVREYNQSYGEKLALPKKDESRTYVINATETNLVNPSSLTIYPIVKIKEKEKVCKNYAQGSFNTC